MKTPYPSVCSNSEDARRLTHEASCTTVSVHRLYTSLTKKIPSTLDPLAPNVTHIKKPLMCLIKTGSRCTAVRHIRR